MAGDLHVVRLVGQNEAGGIVAVHEPPKRRRVGRAAADDPVGSKLEHVAEPRGRGCGRRWRQRASLDGLPVLGEDDLVDFIKRETGDLDRRIGEDQFLELDFEFEEVPLALLAEPIGGEPQRALLDLRQMIDPHARDTGKAKQPRRLNPDGAVEDQLVLAYEHRHAKAERAYRARDIPHMGGIAVADFSRWQVELVQQDVDKLEPWQDVVALPPRYRREGGQPSQALTAAPALRLQLIRERMFATGLVGVRHVFVSGAMVPETMVIRLAVLESRTIPPSARHSLSRCVRLQPPARSSQFVPRLGLAHNSFQLFQLFVGKYREVISGFSHFRDFRHFVLWNLAKEVLRRWKVASHGGRPDLTRYHLQRRKSPLSAIFMHADLFVQRLLDCRNRCLLAPRPAGWIAALAGLEPMVFWRPAIADFVS